MVNAYIKTMFVTKSTTVGMILTKDIVVNMYKTPVMMRVVVVID